LSRRNMTAPRILTFNFHEPYLCLMAKTGLDFTVGSYLRAPLARPWQVNYRPIPANMTFVAEASWRSDLEAGRFDVVITHNETNAADVLAAAMKSGTAMLHVCHNRRAFLETTVSSHSDHPVEDFRRLLDAIKEQAVFVFVSESKRRDYGIPGKVILPGIDIGEYGGYRGEKPQILRVGNVMRARNLIFDVDFQERVCAGLPSRVMGADPELPGAAASRSFEDLLETFRSLRCLLHVTREQWEDGYNLAMLEAMACGMPVVALANATCPLTHGVDGLVSGDAESLRSHLKELLADRDLAAAIGAKGRETVARRFPLERFLENWRAAIEEAAESTERKRPSRRRAYALPRLRILLDYGASVHRPGTFYEEALRKHNDVVAVRCPPEPAEGVHEVARPIRPGPDIILPAGHSYAAVQSRLPADFVPDLYLWMGSGAEEIPAGLEQLRVAKACLLLDSRGTLDERVAFAQHFNFVFLTQKRDAAAFNRKGVSNASWLPPALSPGLHELRAEAERPIGVSFLASPCERPSRRRQHLMDAVARRFPDSRTGVYSAEERARIFAQSRIAVHISRNRAVDGQIFDVMAAGAMLIADEADGLEELFRDGEHLVVCRNDDALLDLIMRFLTDDDARRRIAENGRRRVYEVHTYDLRAELMLTTILEGSGHFGGASGESRFHYGGYYRSPRTDLAQHVPAGARRVLDVGCGGGELGRYLKQQRNVGEVAGVEINRRSWELAREVLDQAILGDVEKLDLPFADGYFDCIIFGDVLEHLVWPGEVLRKAARVLAADGIMVISIPNVRFYQVFEMLARGRWKYEDAGILDRTHLRFFTVVEMRELVREAGLELVKLTPLSMAKPEQLPRNADGSVQFGRVTLRGLSDAEYADLLVYQYLIAAAKPCADPLEAARRALEEGRYEASYRLAEQAQRFDEAGGKALRAKAAAKLGSLEEAERLYRDALALRPADAAARGELGIVLVAMNCPGDAASLLEEALEAAPDNAHFIGALGLARWMEGRQEQALEQFKAALELDFDQEALQGHLIEAASQLDRLAEAEPLLRRFVDLHPGNLDLACRHALILHHMGRSGEARDRLDAVLVLAPRHQTAHELLARIDGDS